MKSREKKLFVENRDNIFKFDFNNVLTGKDRIDVTSILPITVVWLVAQSFWWL